MPPPVDSVFQMTENGILPYPEVGQAQRQFHTRGIPHGVIPYEELDCTAPIVAPDINLRDEIESDRRSRTVTRVRDCGSVRRVYSAKVVGLEGNMTVAMYHSDGAEKEWREDILQYSWLRTQSTGGGGEYQYRSGLIDEQLVRFSRRPAGFKQLQIPHERAARTHTIPFPLLAVQIWVEEGTSRTVKI
ncbi:hypothetical protein B0H13DRAFT_1905407 [Mycena leptocephala]|nr:hypothetical protein B0H13DRAFT_1905407 [Mycena leptocephala]